MSSEEQWQKDKLENGECGFYSDGDGITTFRLPLINSFARARGLSSKKAGDFEGDAIRNITGNFTTGRTSAYIEPAYAGAFKGEVESGYSWDEAQAFGFYRYYFDTSKVVPTAEENRPKSITFLYCVKAFDASINQGLVDVSELVNDLTSLSNRLDKEIEAVGKKADFTFIYPNGGSEQAPALVSAGSRYVEDNPFPGTMVICQVEVCYLDQWGVTLHLNMKILELGECQLNN